MSDRPTAQELIDTGLKYLDALNELNPKMPLRHALRHQQIASNLAVAQAILERNKKPDEDEWEKSRFGRD